jgi:hypothetical protein
MLSNKDPLETVPVIFDFVNLTATPASPVVTVVVASGTDGNPSAILSGSPTVSGTKVQQFVTGGVNNVSYTLTCKVTPGDGSVYLLKDTIKVVTQ